MDKKLVSKNLLLGFLSWLIPFVVSIFFFRPGEGLIVQYATFKCIMSVTGITTGSYLLFRYFRYVNSEYVRQGIIVGVSWTVINLVLDFIFLVPMAKLTLVDYLLTIGISYLAIPPISISMGYLIEAKK